MMTGTWSVQSENLGPATRRLRWMEGGRPISTSTGLRLWAESPEFRAFHSRTLAGDAYAAFFWEMPPLTRATLDQPFECVLVDAPALTRITVDPGPFRAQFAAQPGNAVIAFPNLGGDAVLVVPAPAGDNRCFAHLAAFLRGASEPRRHALWRTVADALRARVSDTPVWLSTAGLGVSWLHLRLDSRPKYYRHAPYRTMPPLR